MSFRARLHRPLAFALIIALASGFAAPDSLAAKKKPAAKTAKKVAKKAAKKAAGKKGK